MHAAGTNTWSYRPALDGLRTVAVYLVLLFHTGATAVGGGFIGVDLFFVLSGFLVSNVILSEIDRTGRLDFGRFYARRVRRLLPAAASVVVATSALFLLLAPVPRRLPLVADAQSALLYVANWNFLFQQNDYFAEGVDESPFLHFWSLAIEEQFYVVFPLVLLVLVTLSRRWRPALATGLVGLFLLSLGSQLFWAARDVSWAYYGTDARLYQLVAGALLAVGLRGLRRGPSPRGAHVVAVAGLAGMLVLGSGLLEMTPSWRGIAATAASVALVGGLMTAEGRPLTRALSQRGPVFLGKVSYGTYLWHWPVILTLEQVLDVRPAVVAILAIGVSTGLAALSFEVLEHPVRTARALHRFRWSASLAGVTASALVAVSIVPALLESPRAPRLAQPAAAAVPPSVARGDGVTPRQRVAPVPDIDWRGVMDDVGPTAPCSVKRPADCVVVEGDGPHIALVGDSHARMLGPMFIELAEEHDLTLSLNVMAGCGWQANAVITNKTQQYKQRCDSLRAEWYEKALPALEPDLVVLASQNRDDEDEWGGVLTRRDDPDASLADVVYGTTMDTVEKITSQGPRVLIVEDMMGTSGLPVLDCLASATRIDQCQVPMPTEKVASNAYYQVAALRSDKVFTVDVNPIVCVGEPLCLPVVDGIVVWKNKEHFTTEITTHLRAEIWAAIRETGALDDL